MADEEKALARLRTKEFRELAEAVRSGTLEGEVLKTVEQLTSNWQADLQAYTIGLARMKAVSITKVLEVILKVQDELMRRIDLKQASIGELTGLLRVLRDINNEDVEFIHDLAFGKGEKLKVLIDNRVDNRTVQVGAGGVKLHGGQISQEGAERIRRLVDGVLRRVEGKTEDSKILEAGS